MGQPESFIRIAEFKRVYQKALAAGKGDTESAMEALEAAKEVTVNFARAGNIARAYNQMTPYFSASFAGQRKMLRSLAGMEGLNDADRARRMSFAMANALVGITAPAFAVWALTYNEDWYRDLPEWRKRHFINMKWPGSDTILSFPLPFELGTIAASLPIAVADHLTDSNPISIFPTLFQAMFPYLDGAGQLLPAGAKPWLEARSGYDFFTQREQTPFWVQKTKIPEEQMRAGTAVTVQELYKIVPDVALRAFGIDNPIELQHFLGGFTAGGLPTVAKSFDELMKLKDHPGIQPGVLAPFSTFLNRFARQKPHRASATVDEFYRMAETVEQKAHRTGADRRLLRQINQDRNKMSAVRKRMESGQITRVEADRLIFEIANKRLQRVK
jgi:hypothetical protein